MSNLDPAPKAVRESRKFTRDAELARRVGRSGRRFYLFTERWYWAVGVEWKPQDFWVGAFWKTTPLRFDFWLCLLPMVPVHLSREVR